MSVHARNIKESILRLSDNFGKDYVSFINAKVVSVSESERTCIVEPVNGEVKAKITATLSAQPNDGIIITPSIDSIVVVGISNKHDYTIIQYSDIDKVRITIGQFEVLMTESELLLGDGSFDGLVKASDLATQYNNRLDSLLTAIRAGFNALSGIDSGVSLAAFNASATSITHIIASSYTNNKIKHGS